MAEYTTHHFNASSSFTVSVGYDRRLAPYDVVGSVAHARMLGIQGVITAEAAQAIIDGLERIGTEVTEGTFPWRDSLEDVHMNIEHRLFELIGEVAGRLHTARSRNDQVATATRLFLRDALDSVVRQVRQLEAALVGMATRHQSAIMPGYTHMQRAQPVLFAHHLLAYVEMLARDEQRLADCRRRVNVLPLGSGALAGVPYPLDRDRVARELGFEGVSSNSMDAVSDRDYLVEFQALAAIVLMHCSRLAEDIVLWTSREFGFVRLSAEWLTGSSMMPQKRNPDFAELARGKTGRVYGNLLGLLTVLKGLPLSYNTDLQEDKESLFDTVDTLSATLDAFQGMLSTAEADEERMAVAASDPLMLATDLADSLVAKGVSFRRAHEAVSALCEESRLTGVGLSEIPLDTYRRHHKSFDGGVYSITAQASIEARNILGGTAPKRVAEALEAAKRRLKEA